MSSPSPLSVITNADQGAAVVSPAPPGANQYGQLTYVSANAISGQTALPFLASGAGSTTFWPQLQREDGSYIGTIGEYCPGGSSLSGSCGPLNNENGQTVAAVGASGVVWQQQFASPVLPLYATSDGGATVTSTQLADNQRQLGTLYTLDPNGNLTSQSADTGAVPSWTNQWYVDPPETVSSVVQNPIHFVSTWAAILGQNHSGTGAAVQQQWYPPLPSCMDSTLNPPVSCPGPQELLNAALAQLKSFASENCGDSSQCVRNVFNKINAHYALFGIPETSPKLFFQFLSKGTSIFDGSRSTFRMDFFQCGGYWYLHPGCLYDGTRVRDWMTANEAVAVTLPAGRLDHLEAFFAPQEICPVAPAAVLNESSLFHEALHGFLLGASDAWLETILGGILPPSINITYYLENNVLSGGPQYSISGGLITCPN